MSFIDDAKEALNERFNRLELLARKSGNFETNSDEDKELFDLKEEVKEYVAQRDRAKNLSFLADGKYSLAEVLTVMKATKEDVNKALKSLFPADVGVSIGTVKTTKDSKEVVEEIRNGKPLSREAMKTLKGNEKAFVKCLSAEGKELLLKSHKATVGRAIGQLVYPNISPLLTRFKLDKAKLLKELTAK